MSRSSLVKLAIINPANPSDKFVFSAVQEGAEGASRQSVSIEEAGSVIIEDGRKIITAKKYGIAVTALRDFWIHSKLSSWQSNRTPVIYSGYDINGRILQKEGFVDFDSGFESHASFRITSTVEAIGDYINGKHSSLMSFSKNGLALYRFEDDLDTEVANGWTNSGTGQQELGVTNAVQDYDNNGGTGTLSRNVYFPFPDQTLTFGVNVNTYSDNDSNGSVKIKIRSKNSSGTVLSTQTETISALGDSSVSITLSSTAVSVDVIVENTDIETFSFSKPTLKIGAGFSSATDFVEFNT